MVSRLSQNKPQAASTLGSESMVTEQERPGPSKEQPAPAGKQQGHDAAAGTQTIVGCALLPKKVMSVENVLFVLPSGLANHRIRPQVTRVRWGGTAAANASAPSLSCPAGQVARYLTQRMLQTAADNNIQIKQIDYTQPLEPQGPFHVIIHKLRPNPGTGLRRMPSAAACGVPHRCTAHTLGVISLPTCTPAHPKTADLRPVAVCCPSLCPPADWEQQLRQYVSNHPETVVVDRIDKIRQLHNRATMLRPLQGDGVVLQQPVSPTHCSTCALPHPGGINSSSGSSGGQVVLVQAPLQVEIAEGTTEAEAQAALAAAGLAPPLLCKPLWTDGRDGSHKLAVLHDLEALGRLLRGAVCNEFKPPLVVQQFVEHGGVLFKVGGWAAGWVAASPVGGLSGAVSCAVCSTFSALKQEV